MLLQILIRTVPDLGLNIVYEDKPMQSELIFTRLNPLFIVRAFTILICLKIVGLLYDGYGK